MLEKSKYRHSEMLLKRQNKNPSGRRGIKSAGPELENWLRLANLVSREQLRELPPPPAELTDRFSATKASLLDYLAVLPEALRLELLDYLSRLPPRPAKERRDTGELIQAVEVIDRLRQIVDVARFLRRLILSGPPRAARFWTTISVEGNRLKFQYVDPFMRAIENVDITYIRECAVCGRIFFARRSTSAVCDPQGPCAATYSKRQERANAERRNKVKIRKDRRK
jgi:hypothetical protein